MSIVLDALKRAEREHHVSISNTPFEQRKLSETKALFKKTIVGIAFLNLVAITVAYFMFQKPLPVPPVSMASPVSPAVSRALLPSGVSSEFSPQGSAAQEVPAAIPTPAPEKKESRKIRNFLSIPGGPEIKIDGVFMDKKGAFVLFGDEMLAVGEDLNGATIAGITLNKVTVEHKGQRYEILA